MEIGFGDIIISYEIKGNIIILKYENGKVVKLPYDKNSKNLTHTAKETLEKYEKRLQKISGIEGVFLPVATMISCFAIMIVTGTVSYSALIPLLFFMSYAGFRVSKTASMVNLRKAIIEFEKSGLIDKNGEAIEHNLSNDKSMEQPTIGSKTKSDEEIVDELSLEELCQLKEELKSIEKPAIIDEIDYQKTLKPKK